MGEQRWNRTRGCAVSVVHVVENRQASVQALGSPGQATAPLELCKRHAGDSRTGRLEVSTQLVDVDRPTMVSHAVRREWLAGVASV